MGTSVPVQETSFWEAELRCAHTHPVGELPPREKQMGGGCWSCFCKAQDSGLVHKSTYL